MSSTHAIGIDLGTTRSAVSHVSEGGITTMLPNGHEEIFTPSIVLFRNDERIVGREAERRLEFETENIAIEPKRDIGEKYYRHPVQGRQIPPEVIQACILRSLRGDVMARFGDDYQAVVTVPAYFDESRRTATSNAAEMADLNLLDIVNEPTAAALAFGERLGYLKESGEPNIEMNILVYDLGGGTFDVTIVRLAEGLVQTVATDGDMQLGGSDWDSRMVALLRRKFGDAGFEPPNDDAGNMRLRRLAIEAKHTLSSRDQATVRMEIDGSTIATSVSRSEFEESSRDLVERTAFTTRQVMTDAKVGWSDIGRVLLVGGATRMPMVQDLLTSASGIPVDSSVNPDEAVSRGAAIYAQYRLAKKGVATFARELTITNVNSHSLGIEGINMATMRKEKSHVIPRNTPLPCVVNRKFVTKVANQKSVVIKVLEGEGRTSDGCIPLGRAVLRNLPPGLPAGHGIHVEYQYDTNGRLTVRGQIPGYGDQALVELQRTRALSDTRLAAWKTIVCRDGGFNDFHDALNDLLVDEAVADSDPVMFEDASPAPKRVESEKPAYDFGAPQKASEILKEDRAAEQSKPWRLEEEFPQTKRTAKNVETVTSSSHKRKSSGMGVYILGHFLASAIGLVIGYYLLIQIRPEMDFLNLSPMIEKFMGK